MTRRALFCALAVLLAVPVTEISHARAWSSLETPAQGDARSIGETSAGCLRGAQQLPAEGAGFLVMHLERHRDWGHPELLSVIKALGREVVQGLGMMHVGDLGMVRGGPMPFGHRSHQSGLDADIWFDLDPNLHHGLNADRSNLKARSLLSPLTQGLDESLWSESHLKLLRAAAGSPSVDRIFVNARIKQRLCERSKGPRDWLRKIRPWYYHEDHLHLRLRCPEDSPSCIPQEPIPLGDGCDALGYWLAKPATPTPEKKTPSAPPPSLPTECRRVLAE